VRRSGGKLLVGAGDRGVLNALMENQLGLRPEARFPAWTRPDPDHRLDNIYAPTDAGIQSLL
jgi:hypothetical protein